MRRRSIDSVKTRRRRRGTTADSGEANPDVVRAIERSILQIVRNMGRRSLGRSTERRLDGLVDFSHVAVIDALGECNAADAAATVGQIGRCIGADPSRASRMVAKAIRAGYVKRLASQEDGRRTCVALTRKGEEFMVAIGELRGRYFATHLKTLSQAECETFADLLAKFLQSGHGRQPDDANEDSHGAMVAFAEGATVVPLHPTKPGETKRSNRRRRA